MSESGVSWKIGKDDSFFDAHRDISFEVEAYIFFIFNIIKDLLMGLFSYSINRGILRIWSLYHNTIIWYMIIERLLISKDAYKRYRTRHVIFSLGM